MNPYKILNVDTNATDAEIKKAYRKLSMSSHPDQGGNPEKFMEINLAYRILSDPKKRKIYDTEGIIMDESPEFIPNIIKSRLASILDAWIETKLKGQNAPIKKFFSINIDKAISEVTNNNSSFKRKIEKLKHIRKNITCKSESNMMYAIIDQKIEMLNKAINQNEREKEILIGLKIATEDYDFEDEDISNGITNEYFTFFNTTTT